jgi:alkaline phosphatase D
MQCGSRALGTVIVAAALATWTSPVPAQDAAPLTRIAFGSCAHQAKPQPIWDAVLDYRPELFIFAGDNVYGDVSSGAMTELASAYAKAATIEGYGRVRAAAPVLAT